MKAAFLALSIALLCGCQQRGLVPPGCPTDVGGTPSDVLGTLAMWSAYIGGAGLLLCAIAVAFVPNKWTVAKLAIAFGSILVGSQILYWLGKHLVLATVLIVICGIIALAAYLWANRKAIEKRMNIDLDGDDSIGNAPTRVFTKTERHL